VYKYLWIILIGLGVIFCSKTLHAEDYSDCRARCAQEETDCMNEPQDSDLEVQRAKEAACARKAESCYAECENFKPTEDVIAPENNPNIIRR